MTRLAALAGAGVLVVAGLVAARLSDSRGEASAEIRGRGVRRGTPVVARLDLDASDSEEIIVVDGVDSPGGLSVTVASAGDSAPPVAGRYHVGTSVVEFRPLYPLVPGVAYRVRASGSLDTTLAVPRDKAAGGTIVTAVYPTADSLPMNLLKLYVHFSAPMRAGDAVSHIRLVDAAADTVVPDAFFRMGDELWDPSQTRLTVLFDPARIKRGLVPNAQLGLPLRSGRTYRLEIDPTWADAQGVALERGFVKQFTVVDPDRVAPSTRSWTVRPPAAGTREPLVVSFGEPMDQALALRLLVVRDAHRVTARGTASLGLREQQWQFVPDVSWSGGTWWVDVDTRLEDVAGNSLRRLFDADLRHAGDASAALNDTVSLGFLVQRRLASRQPHRRTGL
ncbi:MAG TPA: hypothetical protein VM076_17300 [Gemmatimonadaceae bacterium]|nr:hypothetical protein [Gemmatimonadaceae bacterium]